MKAAAGAAGAVLIMTSCAAELSCGSVPYRVLDHYFVRNDAPQFSSGAVASEETFDRIFAPAAVMGPGGQPEKADFSRQTVIAVTEPETSRPSEIEPVSLTSEHGVLTLTYRVRRGAPQSYVMKPLLLIAADRRYGDSVVLKALPEEKQK